jgi:hypothetical protein
MESDTGQNLSEGGFLDQPYEAIDEENADLGRGGEATLDQMQPSNAPDALAPDDQDTRQAVNPLQQVADTDTNSWDNQVSLEEQRQQNPD